MRPTGVVVRGRAGSPRSTRPGCPSQRGSCLTVRSALEDPDVDDREDERHPEQDDRDRRRISRVRELEGLLPEVEDHRLATAEDPAGLPREDVDLVEDLWRSQARDDRHEDDLRAESRDADVAVLLELAAAIDLRGVVQLFGDVLETGQEDDRVVAEPG